METRFERDRTMSKAASRLREKAPRPSGRKVDHVRSGVARTIFNELSADEVEIHIEEEKMRNSEKVSTDLLMGNFRVDVIGTFPKKKPPPVQDYPWGGFNGRRLEMVGKTRKDLEGLFDDLVVRRRS